MNKKIKKTNSVKKRKYEFKAEKEKKIIIKNCLIGLAIALIIVGISLGGLKVYNSNHKNATVSNQIVYKGLNSGIILNANYYYGSGFAVKPSSSSYIYTGINDTISITAPVIKNKYKKSSYRFVVYNLSGRVINNGTCRTLDKGKGTINKTETFTLESASYGVFQVYPSSTNCSGNVLEGSLRTVKITLSPTINVSLGNQKINSNTALKVSKIGTYNPNITMHNYSGQTLYYRWFTYNSFNWSTLYYKKATCSSFTSAVTASPELNIYNSYPNRMGYIRIYGNYNDCKSDNEANLTNSYNNKNGGKINYISSFIIKLQGPDSKSYSTGDKKILNFNESDIKNKIGKQSKSKCYDYSAAYGLYILSGKKKIGNYSGAGFTCTTAQYGSKNTINNAIKKNIDANLPVVLHGYSSRGQHWVLVVGYNPQKSPSEWTKSDIWVLDPATAKVSQMSQSTMSSYPYKDGQYNIWTSISKAKNCQ